MENNTTTTDENIEKKYVETTVPLKMEQIKDYFKNQNQIYLIDYHGGELKGEMLLAYISNLDLPCNLLLDPSKKDDVMELLKAYFVTKSICEVDFLILLSAQIVLENVGFDTFTYNEFPEFLTKEEIDLFIKENKEIVDKWTTFIASTMLYQLTVIKDLENEYEFSSKFPEIDDPNYVGYNVIQLFSLGNFTTSFFSVPYSGGVHYFVKQFNDYMFGGKSFFDYYSHPNNLMFVYLEGVLSGTISKEVMNNFLNADLTKLNPVGSTQN